MNGLWRFNMKPMLQRIYTLRGWFWILVVIAMLVVHFGASLFKIWHPQPQYHDWLSH